MRLVQMLTFVLLASTARADMPPGTTEDEAARIYAAGGFLIDGTVLTNHCGQPATPTLQFSDMNGDGKDEAIFTDKSACYPGGYWTSILTRSNAGWIPVLAIAGSAKPLETRTDGWPDMDLTLIGQGEVMRFDGNRYAFAARKLTTVAELPDGKPPIPENPSDVDQPPKKENFAAVEDMGQAEALPAARPGEIAISMTELPGPAEAEVIARAFTALGVKDAAAEGAAQTVVVGHADLNGDGAPDLLARQSTVGDCTATGCPALALLAKGTGLSPTPIALPPFLLGLYVDREMHRGMHDLRFDDSDRIYRWDGTGYR